jgi:predicted DNA-binding transcriptional regulator YafY
MTNDAAVQLRRLLRLIPKLADGESHTLAEIARLAGADTDTVLADLRSLSYRFGDPGGFVPGLQIFIEASSVTLHTSHFDRPMRLTVPELCALELGLAMLRRERPEEEHEGIDQARARLRTAIGRLPAAEERDGLRYAELAMGVDTEHLATLRTGVRERKKARITYRRADSADSHTRVICPYGLVAANGAWYVVAHCDDRNAIRIFRLDRIERASLTGTAFDVPASFSLDGVVENGKVFLAEEPESLRVRYSPAIARWIAEREGVAPSADGSVTVEHPLADVRWAVRHVLQYGPDAEVVGPESVRAEIAARLRRIAGG